MEFSEQYKSKLCSAKQIADQVQSGWNCTMDIAAAIPTNIINEIGERAKAGDIKDVKLHSVLDVMPLSALSPEASQGITPVSWFSGGGLRKAVNEGRADIMSCHYRDIPSLHRDYVDTDAFFATVSPMDSHGWFSSGAVGSYSEVLYNKAKRIYLEVNPNMPRTFGSPMIHISQVAALCESDTPLPALPATAIDEISHVIGGMIAEEIPNGATLQLGIGAVPEAVGLALRQNKHDMGIHTELFTESMVDMIESGVVTNQLKPIHRGKSVATLVLGTKRTYNFINDNPAFLMLPVDYVNDPNVIAQHPNFISVNAALEVDFYGQVCAESMGTKHMSGSGGQADYVRGAVQSKGGKSFIAFPSTAKGGTVSRIAPTLSKGALVTTSKNDVDYIVTEYGVAKLRGKTLSQRTKALISIAHPNFRDELTSAAKQLGILI